MRTVVTVAHGGAPQPHDLWGAWDAHPVVVLALLLAAALYVRGRSHRGRWRALCFGAGLLAVAVALLSPVAAVSEATASGHMVQHLLLTVVAAPLLALSTPSAALLRGSPAAVRRGVVRWRSRLSPVGRALHNPGVVWLLHVGTLWIWHSAAAYDAALEHSAVHAAEHATFLATGVLFWRVVVGSRASRTSPGVGILLLFTMSLQAGLLSLLLTFSSTPWYGGYATTTQPWGLTPLADQRLAGAVMWVPGGAVYLAAALALLVTWLRATEAAAPPAAVRAVEPAGR